MSTLLQHLQDLEMADALVVVGAVDGVAGVDGHLLDAAPVAAAPALVVRARRRPRPDQHPPPAGNGRRRRTITGGRLSVVRRSA